MSETSKAHTYSIAYSCVKPCSALHSRAGAITCREVGDLIIVEVGLEATELREAGLLDGNVEALHVNADNLTFDLQLRACMA